MSEDAPSPPFIYEGLDPTPEPKPTIEKVSEAVRGTAKRVGDAIDAGRKPGMPPSILSNIARSASWFAVSRVSVGCCLRPPPMMAGPIQWIKITRRRSQ
jgi:hypothetical protein